jgi:beta-glucosidase
VPLFPFGAGLSYTSFAFGDLRLSGGKTVTAAFAVTNTGRRAGIAVPQLYATPERSTLSDARHLVGWAKIALAPGETRRVTVTADPRLLGHFDAVRHVWRIDAGAYKVFLGRFAGDAVLAGDTMLDAAELPP